MRTVMTARGSDAPATCSSEELSTRVSSARSGLLFVVYKFAPAGSFRRRNCRIVFERINL